MRSFNFPNGLLGYCNPKNFVFAIKKATINKLEVHKVLYNSLGDDYFIDVVMKKFVSRELEPPFNLYGRLGLCRKWMLISHQLTVASSNFVYHHSNPFIAANLPESHWHPLLHLWSAYMPQSFSKLIFFFSRALLIKYRESCLWIKPMWFAG